jgi:histidinol phosphatase-like enzyme (inositol monophosphatase family)
MSDAMTDELDTARLDESVSAMLADAGQVALRHFRTAIQSDDKGGVHGFDPVTEADRGVEDLLRARLHDEFGDHEVLGEERGSSGTPGRYRWLIDPIDGTKSFVTGSPLWGILLGLLDRGSGPCPEDPGRPVAGWMHQPYIGETFGGVVGHTGGGSAWIERDGARSPLTTRNRRSIGEAQMYTTFPGMFWRGDERAAFDRLSSTVQLARFGGDCYAYCLLAMGHIDLVVEASLQPYDIVALIPIVEGAGGIVTGRHGEPAAGGGFVVAAANEQIHEQALAVLNHTPHQQESP